ncbi:MULTISPECIES: hypothetical protein [unclassified Sphingomonas]|uniref:hypothetical protein n=1 Tax=unclassified Sphingomonas TaxID=196159 RepID=UPI0006F83999|nr:MULTISPECIES: hypothetical protein [unclassified Sphingomonas]KQM27334.1 hypothetical protein ASE58_10380 [Sphingomonas sp. Leaf9]KQM43671.1 hypothetical protein ASE57_10385 [Sphingomonas sp. Leaf11]
MRNHLCLGLTAILLLPATAGAQSTTTIRQGGTSNEARVDQAEAAGTIDIAMDGAEQRLIARQRDLASLDARLNGVDNRLTVYQGGAVSDGNTALVTMQGSSNEATLHQMADGIGHNATLQQQGAANVALLWQDGSASSVSLTQIGDANQASISQRGVGNDAIVTQIGNLLGIAIDQMGGAQISVTQTQ